VQQATIARIQTKKHLNIICTKSDGPDCEGLQTSSFPKILGNWAGWIITTLSASHLPFHSTPR
jgi:hypothetical protein